MTTEIKNSYLMWIGAEHYPTIDDWASEAVTRGISKRIPGVSVGAKLLEPGSVIFIAHDEGEYSDCPECTGTIVCPECRKAEQEAERVQAEIDKLLKRYSDREAFEIAATGAQKRSLKVRDAKLEKLADEQANCELCGGKGTLEAGTGGTVEFYAGNTMDYRSYNYWLHQPAKFDDKDVAEKKICAHCGGTGKLPEAKVFGMFLPEGVEYILKGDEDEEALEKVKEFAKLDAKVAAAEVKRGCGKRHPGGLYAVTVPGGESKRAKRIVKELVEAGAIDPEAVEINGTFVRFIEPIDVDVKRFRGIKSWSLNVDVEDAAEEIMEAMA